MKTDYDLLAQEYARHRQVHPAVLANLIQTGAIKDDALVLDVGCGTGNYIIAVTKATGCLGWGLEPSTEMMAVARQRAPNIDFRQGQAEQLPYPAGFFDLVFSVDVIHHVQDRPAYLREAHRVVKPCGKFCTVTDSAEIIRNRQPLSNYFPETVAVELQRYPAIADLRAMLKDAGFYDIQEATAEFAFALTDIQPYQNKAFSCLHLIPADAFARGIERMEADLQTGPIPAVVRYLLVWATK